MTCDERRDLILLYVADALDAAEREEVRRHLAVGCVACTGHLAEARAAFAAVSLGADPVPPPPDLVRRVFDRIDRVDRATVRGFSPWRWLLPSAAAAALAAIVTYTGVTRHDRAALADVRLSYNADARAALLQATLADQDQTVDQLRRKLGEQQQLVDALSRPDGRVVALAGAAQPRASARLVWAPSAGRSVLLATDLTPLPAGRTYELWFVTADGRKVPAGTFPVDGRGSATVTVPIPSDLGALAVAAVTEEPAGGAPTPTLPIQMAGKAP